jgi:hypothetical protein
MCRDVWLYAGSTLRTAVEVARDSRSVFIVPD